MAEKITSINPAILVWARDVSGTTLQEAQDKFGVDKITAWESGNDHPTYSQLQQLGKFYRKPIAVFFFPEPPVYVDIPASCRTLPVDIDTVFNRDITKVVDWARAMQLNLYELNDGVNPSTQQINSISFDFSSIATTANQLRNIFGTSISKQESLKSAEKAFEHWRDCLYDIGVYVFKAAFKDNSVSGFCLYDDVFPIICINNSLAHARQIFTLFHEVYHLIMQNSGIDLIEKSYNANHIEWHCHEFAGTFLVPKNDFLQSIGNRTINDELIETFSKKYSVSREVILRKLFDLSRIDYSLFSEKSNEYKEDYLRITKLDEQGRKKGGGNYYSNQTAYKGKHYLELSYSKYYQQQISLIQLSQYLGMKVNSVRELASWKGWGVV